MIKLHLERNRRIVELHAGYLAWIDSFPFVVKSLCLKSYEYEQQDYLAVFFYVDEFEVASFLLSEAEFINIHTVFKPETNDELNILNRAEVKTADTDQVPAAGTNNAAIV